MAKKIVIDLEVKSDQGVKEVDKLNKKLKNTNEELSGATNTLDKFTGGAVSKIKGFKGAVGNLAKGFKSLRFAIISTGIGALLIAITAVSAAFNGSEEGQNKYAKLMAVIGAITGNIVDLFADLGELIIGLFSGDSEAIKSIKSFGKKLFDLVGLPIKNTIDIVKALGKALGDLFSGDISGAFDELKKGALDVKQNFSEAKDVIVDATKSIKNYVKEQLKEGNAAAKVADMRAKADKIERKLIVERSKLESEIALLRLKSRQEDKFSAKERKQALLDAQKLEDGLLDKETEYLKLRRDAQIEENTFSRSNKANLTAEAEAIAAVNRQVASRANTARQVQREVNTISKQIQAKENEKEKAEDEKQKKIKDKQDKKIKEEADAETKRLESIEKIQEDFKKKKEDKDAETQIQKIELEQTRALEELDRLNATEEQKANIKSHYAGLITDEETKNEKQKEKLDKLRVKQTLGDAKNTFNQIAQLAGKDSKVGKAMAIASATISGVQGVQNAYSTAQKSPITLGFPAYPLVQAGLAGAIALKNITAIKSVNPSGGGSANVPIPTTASAPPAFNVVGASGTNQLASAIGGQSQQPIQAYVVANDVTTSQSMDRNIIEDASIGG